MQIGVWHVSNENRVLRVETQFGLVSSIVAEAGPRVALEFKQFLEKPLDSLVGYVNRESKVDVMLLRIVNDELNGD